MGVLKISKGGQVSVPAEVRHRWKTSTVEVEDRGDELVIRPLADDPIEALRGWLSDAGLPSADEMRRQARDEEAEAEERKWGRT